MRLIPAQACELSKLDEFFGNSLPRWKMEQQKLYEEGYIIEAEEGWRAFFCLEQYEQSLRVHSMYVKPPANGTIILTCMELASIEARRREASSLRLISHHETLDQLMALYGFEAKQGFWEKTL
ncbi:hypothetical protein [Terribacillus saccharophilus]|uniref:N-acetyltransferase domain-containing protein n=1 Tax=Terribacillus saccharophilus TaxID=361277 RepID=A0A268AEJ3_9BACI|nr:hypothetical protein [Terribacillus saccharophilus]PAD22548.1 hypothetical protein CHH64_02215 [Terribacillus saccharophilus]PAF37134.1 hypothetical protein CHH58_09845 [Terribacillus saccharophilus]PAF40520.1 hypothetical protein CHH69_02675 [Terribacillus saccharophilus]